MSNNDLQMLMGGGGNGGNLLLRRRMMMQSKGGGGHNLPPEYQEVEWLRSHDKAYLDLGYSPTITMGFKIKTLPQQTSGAIYIIGATHSGGLGAEFLSYNYNAYSSSKVTVAEVRGTDPVELYNNYYNDGIAKVGEDSVNVTIKSISEDMLLFALNVSGTVRTGNLPIFELEVTEGDELIHAYYPCYRKSDNEPGMYDIIGNTFLINANTVGYFEVGGQV